MIFPTGLQVHLEDMFWVYKLFAEILSWAEQSGTQFFSLSNLLIVSKTCLAICIQLFDIWWSSLDIINDFKAISRMVFFRFGEIINIMILSFVKKFFLTFFQIPYKISIHKKNISKKKISFFQKKKLWKKFWKNNFWKNEIFFLKYFFYKSKFYNELKKKSKKIFLTKLKIMMLIISPKRKNTILEMALKSFILSKLDHQMSKSWKRIAAHELETTSKFDLLCVTLDFPLERPQN